MSSESSYHSNRMIESTSSPPTNINETTILRAVVNHINTTPTSIHDLNKICMDFNIKRRGLYDFLSIASAFNICKKLCSDRFEWNGFEFAENYIQSLVQQVEHDASIKSMRDLFNCSANSSLQNIAQCLTKLFVYLGVKFLDMRQVARLFSGKITKYKTMLRKLYTISSCLEIAGIIGRTSVSAEIKFNFYVHVPEFKGAMDIMSLLNTKKELETEIVFENRRKEFERFNESEIDLHIKSLMPRREIFFPFQVRSIEKRFLIEIE